jgi:hypothetical protein
MLRRIRALIQLAPLPASARPLYGNARCDPKIVGIAQLGRSSGGCRATPLRYGDIGRRYRTAISDGDIGRHGSGVGPSSSRLPLADRTCGLHLLCIDVAHRSRRWRCRSGCASLRARVAASCHHPLIQHTSNGTVAARNSLAPRVALFASGAPATLAARELQGIPRAGALLTPLAACFGSETSPGSWGSSFAASPAAQTPVGHPSRLRRHFARRVLEAA